MLYLGIDMLETFAVLLALECMKSIKQEHFSSTFCQFKNISCQYCVHLFQNCIKIGIESKCYCN